MQRTRALFRFLTLYVTDVAEFKFRAIYIQESMLLASFQYIAYTFAFVVLQGLLMTVVKQL